MKSLRPSANSTRPESPADAWPLKLNRALIAIGVIAFGLIVTDRLLEAFRAGETPDDVAYMDDVQVGGVEATPEQAVAAPLVSEQSASVANRDDALQELQGLFGSRVVFISATTSAPGYLVTENERRVAVGEVVDAGITLAEVTTHQVILDNDGELMIFSLPEPAVQ